MKIVQNLHLVFLKFELQLVANIFGFNLIISQTGFTSEESRYQVHKGKKKVICLCLFNMMTML